MLTKTLLLASAALAVALPAAASDSYKIVRPVIIESGIAGQWVMQLNGPVRPKVIRQQQPVKVQRRKVTLQRQVIETRPLKQRNRKVVQRQEDDARAQQVAYSTAREDQIDPQYLPRTVEYKTDKKPGTIIIDTNNRFLYLVLEGGKARRYGVGVGKPGFEWAGEHKVTRKAEWPDWYPPKEMIRREAAKGRHLPDFMPGGEANPLGARALYLGSSLYRIHGTNAPWTIGHGVSSGCIRMRNQDVIDLYERVNVGTRVIVI